MSSNAGALVSYKLRKTVKRSLSVLTSLSEAPSWLMSLQRAASRRRNGYADVRVRSVPDQPASRHRLKQKRAGL
jgi:hypothetical protein